MTLVNDCLYHKFSGSKHILNKYLKNDFEITEMHKIPYFTTAVSLVYVQVCTHSDIAYIVGMLCRYLSNSSVDHW